MPITSPAGTHAFAFLLARAIGREGILHIRIDAAPPDQQGRLGTMSRPLGAPILRRRPARSIPRSR